MKDKKQKICFDKRYLLLLVAGFLTGRVWLYGINPFGVALFAAVAAERKGRKLLALFVLAGMFSSTEGLSLIKYLTLFLLVLSLEKIQEKWTSHTGQAVYLALLTGGLNMAAGILNSILAVNNMIGLKETLMRIIHSKSLFYWFILKVFDIQMVNSLFVYETVG